MKNTRRRLLGKRRNLWISGKNDRQRFNHVPLATDRREPALQRIAPPESQLKVIKF